MTGEMGSGFCSVEHAMQLLGKSRRSIYGYVNKGRIRKDKRGLLLCDVETILRTLSLKVPPFNKATLASLLARIEKLECDIAVLRRMNGMFGVEPIRPDQTTAQGLHSAASLCIQNIEKMTREEVINWVHILSRLDQAALLSVSELAQEPSSTVLFCKLALLLLKRVSSTPAEDEVDLRLRDDLAAVYRNLRDSLISEVEMGMGATPLTVLRALDTEKEALERRLRQNTTP